MRPAKFNFEPVKKINNAKKEAAKTGFSVNVKYNYISFPVSYVTQNRLEGKLLKWFVDIEKKALGWKVLGDSKELLEDIREYIPIKKTAKQFKFSIRRALRALNITDTTMLFRKLDVNEYTDMHNTQYHGIVHYVILSSPTPKVITKKN